MGFIFQAVTEDKYEILQSVDDAAIVIKNTKEPPLSLTIHLTSPVVREEMEKVLAGGRRPQQARRTVKPGVPALFKCAPRFWIALWNRHKCRCVHLYSLTFSPSVFDTEEFGGTKSESHFS